MSSKFIIKIAVFSLLLTFPLIAFSKKIENRRNNSTTKNITASSPRQKEMLVIGALKKLYAAEAKYYLSNNGFGHLSQLWSEGLIDDVLASHQKYEYVFAIELNFPLFRVYATPVSYPKTGRKSFYIDASCVVRGGDKDGGLASVNDAVIETCTPTLIFENERKMILAMRNLLSAQETYRATVGNGNYAPSFSNLYDAGLIPGSLVNRFYLEYYFTMTTVAQSEITPPTVNIRSIPYYYGQWGFRSFYIDQTGVLRGADRQGGNANENDPPIEESKVEN